MKTELIYEDSEYNTAINFKQYLYNAPITMNIKGKKWILGAGNSDRITVKVKKGIVYILATNSPLDYISLTVIDPKTDYFDSLFCGNGELSYNPYNLPKGKEIFDYSTNYQIRVLSAYM